MQKFTDNPKLNAFLEENKNENFIFFITEPHAEFSGIESDEVSVEKLIEECLEHFEPVNNALEEEKIKGLNFFEVFSLKDMIEDDDKEGWLELIAESL